MQVILQTDPSVSSINGTIMRLNLILNAFRKDLSGLNDFYG